MAETKKNSPFQDHLKMRVSRGTHLPKTLMQVFRTASQGLPVELQISSRRFRFNSKDWSCEIWDFFFGRGTTEASKKEFPILEFGNCRSFFPMARWIVSQTYHYATRFWGQTTPTVWLLDARNVRSPLNINNLIISNESSGLVEKFNEAWTSQLAR